MPSFSKCASKASRWHTTGFKKWTEFSNVRIVFLSYSKAHPLKNDLDDGNRRTRTLIICTHQSISKRRVEHAFFLLHQSHQFPFEEIAVTGERRQIDILKKRWFCLCSKKGDSHRRRCALLSIVIKLTSSWSPVFHFAGDFYTTSYLIVDGTTRTQGCSIVYLACCLLSFFARDRVNVLAASIKLWAMEDCQDDNLSWWHAIRGAKELVFLMDRRWI
jgi:hypothetical protein